MCAQSHWSCAGSAAKEADFPELLGNGVVPSLPVECNKSIGTTLQDQLASDWHFGEERWNVEDKRPRETEAQYRLICSPGPTMSTCEHALLKSLLLPAINFSSV